MGWVDGKKQRSKKAFWNTAGLFFVLSFCTENSNLH